MKNYTENQCINENNLVVMAQAGDRKAINKVIEGQMKMVDHQANYFANNNHLLSKNDFLSAGYDGLMNALEKFVPSEGKRFSAYAYVCVRNSMTNLIKNSTSNLVYLSEPIFDDEESCTYADMICDEENWETRTFEQERNNSMYNSLYKLPKRTQEIVSMRCIEKYKLREVAEHFGTSCQNIDMIVNRALAFIKDDMEYDTCA